MKTCTALVAALIMFGLLLPEANAAHPTRICLDIELDRHTAVSDDDIVDAVRALVGATDDGHPPQQEGCVTENGGAGGGGQIDFEITGASDPDDSDTPETPDMSCDIPADQSSCWAYPPSEENGDQTIAGWIDFDRDNATVELDRSEGWDEEAEPGGGEPDETDVVLWTWTHGDPHPCDSGPGVHCSFGLRYVKRTGVFKGSLNASTTRCEQGRLIRLKRVRPDRNRIIGRDHTDFRGNYRIGGFKGIWGRFYVTTPQVDLGDQICPGGRSATIRVRR